MNLWRAVRVVWLASMWGTCVPFAAQSYAVEAPVAVLAAEANRIETMHRVAPCVVAIFAGLHGGGAGVLIGADGYAVTNFHVVDGQGGFLTCGLNDGRVYDAVLVGIDPTGDVALIKLLGRDEFPFAQLGDSDEVRVGDMVFAMGNPFLLATDFQPTVTYGMVSGIHRYQYPAETFLEYTDCLQVDASINPGNSGGPLFNADGQLIGINGRISVEKRGKVNVGAGYSISINQVMNFLDHLKSGRIVDHATLGAVVTSTSDGAVVVSNILETSEAYRRGLRRDDEIVTFAGRPIRSVNQFKNILGIYPSGWTVPLTIRRDGQRHHMNVRLMGLHRQAELTGEDRPRLETPEGPPKPEDRPGPPHGIPFTPPEPEQKVPEEYASLFEERTGYANYYFNALQQDRLLKEVAKWGEYSKTASGWALQGSLKGDASAELRLQPDAVVSRIGNDFAEQKLTEDFGDVPRGTGGLLGALEHLKHLLVDPRDYFTELYYLGSEPLPGLEERADVLVGTKGLAASRFYFRKSSGEFIGLETAAHEQADPCRIRFGELVRRGDVMFPGSLSIEHADRNFGTLTVESLRFFSPPSAGGGPR